MRPAVNGDQGTGDRLRSTGAKRIAPLDGFRAYAILGVVAVHLLGASGVLVHAEGTDLGVAIWGLLGNTIDAFFIISAFVLFLPAVRRGGDLGGAVNFWVSRGARLLPAYWLTIALCLLLLAWVPGPPFEPTWSEIIGHATLLQMPAMFVDAGFLMGFGINGPVWLISIVVMFYALLPLIARPYYRHPFVGLLIAAAVTIGWKLLLGHRPDLLEPFTSLPVEAVQIFGVDQFPSWAFSLGVGMTGAWAYVRATERWSSATLARFATYALPPLLAAAAVAAFVRGGYALTATGYVSQYARTFPFETMADTTIRAAIIGVVVVGPAWMGRPFSNRITARLAELSYGVYLFHVLLIVYAAWFLPLPSTGSVLDLAIWIAVIMPCALLLAALSRKFVELPILDRAHAWIRRRRAADAIPTTSPVAQGEANA